MQSYGQFCAVARGLEVLGERWTLLVVRELLLGSRTFSDLRAGLPRISTSTLASRLRQLERADLVARDDGGYRLTEAGEALGPVLGAVGGWAMQWDRRTLTDEHLDTEVLCHDLRRRVVVEQLPARPVVVALQFTDRPAADRSFWLHLDRRHVELCRSDTGTPVDLELAAPAAVVVDWWLGRRSWASVIGDPRVRLDGPATLRRQFPRWFAGYVYAARPA